MKILFYDGKLDDLNLRSIFAKQQEPFNMIQTVCIDAVNGPSAVLKELEYIAKEYPDFMVYTNSILALDHSFGWNEKENKSDIYIYTKGQFVNVQNLTIKDLRFAHNIAKIYLANGFDL